MSKKESGRFPGGFIALPWAVLDSPYYADLSHPARALLLELARQYMGDNNGRLLASAAFLYKRGWKSSDVISRAKRQLLDGGFFHQTVQGHRPNKASWYALTWQTLDRRAEYDPGTVETFKRGAFRPAPTLALVPVKPTRAELYERHRNSGVQSQTLVRVAEHGASL